MKVKEEGQACKKCGTPVIRRTRTEPPIRTRRNRSYLKSWLLCPNCKTVYLKGALRQTYPKKTPIVRSFIPGKDIASAHGASWWKLYNEYISSAEWATKRKAILAERGKNCEACGAEPNRIHVHHLTYERIGKELPEDLMVLCVPCHEKAHGRKLGPEHNKRRRKQHEIRVLRVA